MKPFVQIHIEVFLLSLANNRLTNHRLIFTLHCRAVYSPSCHSLFFYLLLSVSDGTEEEGPVKRRRRTSDSFLFLSPKRDEVTLMKLQLAENKLELENEKRRAVEWENMQLRWETGKIEGIKDLNVCTNITTNIIYFKMDQKMFITSVLTRVCFHVDANLDSKISCKCSYYHFSVDRALEQNLNRTLF